MNPSALHKVDGRTWAAMAAIAIGWFGLHTLVATFGPVRHTANFYDLPAVMIDPRWLLWGVSGAHSPGTLVFGLICVLVIALPLISRLGHPRLGWLDLVPLALMLLCGIALYVKSSSTHIEAGEGMGRFGGYVAHLANGAVGWSGDVIGRHIAIGAGGYLALLASGWLAIQWALALRMAGVDGRIAAR